MKNKESAREKLRKFGFKLADPGDKTGFIFKNQVSEHDPLFKAEFSKPKSAPGHQNDGLTVTETAAGQLVLKMAGGTLATSILTYAVFDVLIASNEDLIQSFEYFRHDDVVLSFSLSELPKLLGAILGISNLFPIANELALRIERAVRAASEP